MKLKVTLIAAVLFFATTACDSDTKDDFVPQIDITASDAFPKNCVEVYRGEMFEFKIRLTDNIELGSFSVEMHHNFDHHTHSTSASQCIMEEVKKAIKPFRHIDEYPIPAGLKVFIATGQIEIPVDADTGDYHFTIRVTDATGWQNFEGISMKVLSR